MGIEKELEVFYETMEPHKVKILALLIQLPPSYHLREGLEDLRSYDFLLSSCLIPLARAISLLVIASTSNDFKESLTVLQLIVIIG
jgi:hypothetical protein